ncbi:Peptidoglycan/LPS O-acetylase OafA/YrhL, contains acyltransferase and SGNH-hydrolase domains [Loktanella fryxellensis]|uniref:Peptidoglycan/LPS O-acetylase OafA/YrhL, contains acyltransferase and SGNH-hydrolase domains n=1 Tax=Loktanella fryxellensis TaxID=245187 RepID=A0A1H8H196_9RHOB|nr:Peptidoglycan/LPS O-acetylase OafA/YrhL, contains acyltransferase and SGNH-hydrolase domains [Loktanella fryxellensis]
MLWGHAGLPGLPGAYLFIDTFFVISGYLVCRSLIRSLAAAEAAGQGRWGAIRDFYAGRIRRIAIPLCAAVLLTLAGAWVLFLPDDLSAVARSAQATLTLQAHRYAQSLGDYFDAITRTAPLLHAWSLSLEEWFYIMTPALVLPALIWRRWIWTLVLLALCAASLWFATSLAMGTAGAGYSRIDTRFWQFAAGVILALALPRRPVLPTALNDAAVVAGLALVFASVLILTDKAPSPGIVTLPAVAGIALVLVLQPQSRIVIAATRTPALTFCGRRLYSLYLAHYPVMVFYDYVGIDLGPATDGVKFALALGVSLGFYAVFEAPRRGWRDLSLWRVTALAGTLAAAVVALTGLIAHTGGAPDRLPQQAQQAWAARFMVNPERARCMTGELTLYGYSCLIGPADRPYVALIGDSHSDALAQQLALALDARGLSLRHYWYAECPAVGADLAALDVFPDTCTRLSVEAHQAVMRDPALAGVIYSLRWPWYLDDPDDRNIRATWRGADGMPRGFADMVGFRTDFTAILATSLRQFADRGTPVWLVSPVPSLPDDPVRRQAIDLWHGDGMKNPMMDGIAMTGYLTERATFDRMVADLSATVPVQILDLQDALCNSDRCQVYGGFGSLYYDDNHLNEVGAATVVQDLLMYE